mgnify:CR=1 FL=1
MVKRDNLISEALDCIDRCEHNRDDDLLSKAVTICFVIITDILVQECKAGGVIDQLRFRRMRKP